MTPVFVAVVLAFLICYVAIAVTGWPERRQPAYWFYLMVGLAILTYFIPLG